MIVFRISNELYKEDISGNGAAINGSRWNSKGTRMLYTGEYISLVILESLVHLRTIDIPEKQYLLQIELPDSNFSEIKQSKIKDNWQQHLNYTQWMGDQFVKANQLLILKVPSAIVSQEHNFLVNPLHGEFKKVKVVKTELLELDKRLLLH
ncbi:MAG: RES family NAD+ phosphorylase [Ginsengibacter sp.]